ncbi:MAG TPA: FUSC family protein [Blastocatellia bacterium]
MKRLAMRRLTVDAWPLLQSTVAAMAAWLIAQRVAGHPQPFFAPIATIAALNALLGERGLTALRLLVGVVVGIAVGELVVVSLHSGYVALAIAIFASMAIARALSSVRIVTVQAAASAVLTVVAASGEVGLHRLIDALIGVGVALAFSQILFSPEPVAFLRRAEAAALEGMAEGLKMAVQALDSDDDELAEQAMMRLRNLRDQLAELSRVRRASAQTARHSLVWRSQLAPLARENENAGHLDLLGGSCLILTRSAMLTSRLERRTLATSIHELARVLKDLASDPGDHATRQSAVDRSLQVARRIACAAEPPGSTLDAAIIAIRLVAADIMVFAGVDPDEAVAAAQEGTGEFRVPAPPHAPRAPFRWHPWRPRRPHPQ